MKRDERAIVNIEQKYGKYCYSIAFRILLNEKDTEECINDTWLKVWDSIPPIIPEILSAFIGKITRNQAINKYKYENASKRVNSRIEKTLDELNECEILLNNNVSEEMDRKELENYICETYNVNSEFPWLKFPNYAVFRHNANKKWFALVMNVSKKKLGLSENSEIEILNVKCDPFMIESFKMETGIYPGYHMNKKILDFCRFRRKRRL